MQYYKFKLNLNGNHLNQIVKIASAPEIVIFMYIHGHDSISETKPTKDEPLEDPAGFRQGLRRKYDDALRKKEFSVDKIFGAMGNLPTKVPDEVAGLVGLDQAAVRNHDTAVNVAELAKKQREKADTNPTEQLNLDTFEDVQDYELEDLNFME